MAMKLLFKICNVLGFLFMCMTWAFEFLMNFCFCMARLMWGRVEGAKDQWHYYVYNWSDRWFEEPDEADQSTWEQGN